MDGNVVQTNEKVSKKKKENKEIVMVIFCLVTILLKFAYIKDITRIICQTDSALKI